jgi:hypothetical protein
MFLRTLPDEGCGMTFLDTTSVGTVGQIIGAAIIFLMIAGCAAWVRLLIGPINERVEEERTPWGDVPAVPGGFHAATNTNERQDNHAS